MSDSSNSFTNKELLLKIYELNVDYTQHISETKNEMKHINETVESHEKILQKLSSVPEKIDRLDNTIREFKNMQCEQNENFERRVKELENKGGKTAMNVWKQIGTVVLSSLITLIVGVIFSYFIGGGK